MSSSADLFDLSGRTAVVTGASSGLGVTFSTALAEAGARVVVAARRLDRLREVAGAIESAGGTALAMECDVTDPHSTQAVMDRAIEYFGGLDVVVANAGAVPEGGAMPERMPPEQFVQSIDVNIAGTFNTCQAAGKRMLAAGGGSIVTLASVAGVGGAVNTPVGYSSSKAAIINLTRCLAVQWADRGVRVNSLAPAWFPSEMTDQVLALPAWKERCEDQTAMRRLGRPEELVGPLLLLASDAGSYMTGHVLMVDGGSAASIGTAPYSEELYAVHAAIPGGVGERIMPNLPA